MRITVPHSRTTADVIAILDANFDGVFAQMPLGNVKISDQQRSWNGDAMQFSCNANPGFMDIPIKGTLSVEPAQVVVDLDLPSFVAHFVPDAKIEQAVSSGMSAILR